MGENSKIEWTDHTFNPWIGCQKVSEGCENCYAKRDFSRKPRWANCWGDPRNSERKRTSEANWKKPLMWNRKAKAEGIRRRVFCASLADVFEDADQVIDWRYELWGLIADTPYLDWLLLTKRVENIADYIPLFWLAGCPDNVWLGTTIELPMYSYRTEYIRHLASNMFVSFEPLLGSFAGYPGVLDDVGWVIVGGESGLDPRLMSAQWAREIRDMCQRVGIPFFMKQMSGRTKTERVLIPDDLMVRQFPIGW